MTRMGIATFVRCYRQLEQEITALSKQLTLLVRYDKGKSSFFLLLIVFLAIIRGIRCRTLHERVD